MTFNDIRYTLVLVIRSFKSKETETLHGGSRVRRFDGIEKIALHKLAILESAQYLADLTVPPGNRLKALKGARAGQYSIRINDQYRICFRWNEDTAEDVEIVDYH